jgi:quinol monooxygenase YgiN
VFQVIWTFTVAPDYVAAFERAYGPSGPWAALFRWSAGYLGTELFRSTAEPAQYLTVDRWASRAAYETAQRRHAKTYAQLDAECDTLTVTEKLLGLVGE